MLQHLEILCNDDELSQIDEFVDGNESCTVEITTRRGTDGARNVVRLESYWLNTLDDQPDSVNEAQAERARWARFVRAFHEKFGY